jgi:hypothetical protein
MEVWVTQVIFIECLTALDAKMSFQSGRILRSMDQSVIHPQGTRFLKYVKVVFSSQNCTSILQPLDQGMI